MPRHTKSAPVCGFSRALALAVVVLAFGCTSPTPSANSDFDVVEASVTELQQALESGSVTSLELVELYLARIRAYDRSGPHLNAITRLNPRAREQAQELDAERAAGSIRGPLHGIPVLMKDNYDVEWMPTTGSSLALAGLMPIDNGYQVEALLESGAVILGKTNLHELAAGITTVSSLGGQSRNAYDPNRNPGGSSGGTGAAVAASFATVGWGSDTCGSIRIPAAVHGLFGLRPTKGLSSIDGILPLSHSQDTGGPLARTVRDLAIALDATVGQDPADPATAILDGREVPDFGSALDPEALDGARIGVLTEWTPAESQAGSVIGVIREALDEMGELGATVIDIDFPELDDLLANTGLIDIEFKFDLMQYLSEIPDAPTGSLEDILDAGLHHEALERTFRRRNERSTVSAEELAEITERRQLLRTAVVELMDREDLDVLVYPTMRQETALIGAAPVGSTCFLSAHTGLPALTIPAGFTDLRLPAGVEFLGRTLDDARLVALAYAFEEGAGSKRRSPVRTPPLVNGAPPQPVRIATDPTRDDLVDAELTLDFPTGALHYSIRIGGGEPSGVYGTVIRRRTEPTSIVLRLGGPEEDLLEGSVPLTPRLLRDLLDGGLELLVYTTRGFDHRALTPAQVGEDRP